MLAVTVDLTKLPDSLKSMNAGKALQFFRLLVIAGLLNACATKALPPAAVTLAVSQTDRGVMLWLPDSVLFDFARAEINNITASPYLDRAADILKSKTTKSVVLEGHTDSIGKESANLALSEKRAFSVRNELVLRGVAPERLTVVGLGKSRPLAPNDSELGRKLNRRVELLIIGETVAQLSQNEPANAFEMAFDELRRQLEQGFSQTKPD